MFCAVLNVQGCKCVAHFRRGKKTHYTRKQLTKGEMNKIHNGKFIKGLFKDCEPKNSV